MKINFKSGLIAGSLLFIFCGVAFGSSWHRLAYSKKLGAEVYADKGSGNWCQDEVKIKVKLTESSPLLTRGLEGFLHKVNVVLQKECNSTQVVRFNVYQDEGKTLISSFDSSSSNEWEIHKVDSSNKLKADPSTEKNAESLSAQVQEKTVTEEREYGRGFDGLFVNYFRFNPDLLDKEDYRWWARAKFEREYKKVRRQEFKLNALIEKAQKDFNKTLVKFDQNVISLVFKTSMDEYDFDKKQFNIKSSFDKLRIKNPFQYEGFYGKTVNEFIVRVDGGNLMKDLPMGPSEAELFISKRTNKWNRVNRNVYVRINIYIDHSSYSVDRNDVTVNAKLYSGEVFQTRKLATALYSIQHSQIEKKLAEKKAQEEAAEKIQKERAEKERIAAEARRKREERERLLAQKNIYIDKLKQASLSVRLASYLFKRSFDRLEELDGLADARASAVLQGKPVEVGMLVQMEDSGHQGVSTRWPGMLTVNISDEYPELKSSQWYLVSGSLNVKTSNKLEPATLNVLRMYTCQKDMCLDLADPVLIVDNYIKEKFTEEED